MAVITSDVLAKELERAGVLHDLHGILRVVIDLQAGKPVQIYVQRHGRPELPELLPELLIGSEVVET